MVEDPAPQEGSAQDGGVPDPLPAYAELHCLSNYSFQRGASHPDELVARAKRLGYGALAITDECSVAGVVRAHVAAKAQGLKLLIGAEFRVPAEEAGGLGFTLVLLARNRRGYGQLCELITAARAGCEKGRYRLAPDAWVAQAPRLRDVLVLFAPAREMAAALPGPVEPATLPALAQRARWVQARFPGHCWIAVALHKRMDDGLWLHSLQQLAEQTGLPLVATGQVLMHVRSRKPLHDVITAVRLGQPVAACGFALQPNAQAHLRLRVQLAALYPAALLAQTQHIAALCEFNLDQLRYEYPEEVVPAGETPTSYLRRATYEGAGTRFPQGLPAAVQTQLESELALIAELAYEKYFLTVYDVVRFARSQNILCQGRGSAANSAVCYCLGITAVDPSRTSLLFERFISRERREPPDIDVDFEHQRREEVIQYLYTKYGRERAALTATVISYRPRSAIRDVGKALGIAAETVDKLAKSHQWWDGGKLNPERLLELKVDIDSRQIDLLLELTHQLMGFPRHLSQHPGGFVLTGDRLTTSVPVLNAAMPERTIIEWDKDDIDALGLLKVDVLALGMLSAIRRTLDLVNGWYGKALQLHDVPEGDEPTYDMICAADTIGVFQIESRAQQSMLPRLLPRKFYDLVVEVAIVRPGPIQGGMVHPYLRRRQGLEDKTVREELKPALERTLGVPIFQEQVMQIAVLAAGFTAGEADGLRRSMAAWRRKGGVHKYRDKLIQGMLDRKYPLAFAEAIFKQIEGFGEYGFPESHAASFALLAYSSAWLKCHYPACFLVALLNSLPMGFYGPAQLVQDAQRHGVQVRPVDVMLSHWGCTLEPLDPAQGALQLDDEGQVHDAHEANAVQAGSVDEDAAPQTNALPGATLPPAVRLGLCLVAGLSEACAKRIAAARATAPFTSTEDLALRAGLDASDLRHLAGADALRSLAGQRRQQVWEASALHAAPPLLKSAPVDEDFLELPDAPEGEEIVFDYAALGLTLRSHPLALLRERLASRRLQSAAQLRDLPQGSLVRACGLVTMRQRPQTAKGTIFVTLEDETGTVNVIVWKGLREKQQTALLQARLLAVYGVWQREGEVRHLVAGHMINLTPMLGRLATSSRDFR